jgi:hypothetical protein
MRFGAVPVVVVKMPQSVQAVVPHPAVHWSAQ